MEGPGVCNWCKLSREEDGVSVFINSTSLDVVTELVVHNIFFSSALTRSSRGIPSNKTGDGSCV